MISPHMREIHYRDDKTINIVLNNQFVANVSNSGPSETRVNLFFWLEMVEIKYNCNLETTVSFCKIDRTLEINL